MNSSNIVSETKNEQSYRNHILNYTVTLVRNYDSMPFPARLSGEQKSMLDKEMSLYLMRRRKQQFNSMYYTDIDKNIMMHLENNRLVPPGLSPERNMHISYGDSIAVTYNYINHISITASGISLNPLYKRVKDLEQKFGEFTPYMVNARYGYISPDLLECGLGMKISALVHLGGIAKSGSFEEVKEKAYTRGYVIEPWPGDSTECEYYTVSSRLNYGLTEEELIDRFLAGIKEFLAIEKEILLNYYYNNTDIDDVIYRSIGILKFARKMDNAEMLKHFSNIRTGVKLNKKIPYSLKTLNSIQYAVMQTVFNGDDPLTERAELLRKLMEDDNV